MKVLDEGYAEPIENWGSDTRIIEAARMSTGKGFLGWGETPCSECDGSGTGIDRIDGPGDVYQDKCARCKGEGRTVGDEKLLRYLYENRHHTPFEMAGLTIEIQAPIFVFREWHRHRTQSYNEMSARYTPLPDLNYVPSVERLLLNSKTNKQAGAVAGAMKLNGSSAEAYRESLRLMYKAQEDFYQAALRDGVPKELARIHLPLGRYSRMRASANLRNWLGFLTLRMDEKAQWEIREYANVVGEFISKIFPRTWELFCERK